MGVFRVLPTVRVDRHDGQSVIVNQHEYDAKLYEPSSDAVTAGHSEDSLIEDTEEYNEENDITTYDDYERHASYPGGKIPTLTSTLQSDSTVMTIINHFDFDPDVYNLAPTYIAVGNRSISSSGTLSLTLSDYFFDDEDDTVTYTTTSATTTVATVAIASGTLTVTGVAAGSSVITVEADDSTTTTTITFTVTVM